MKKIVALAVACAIAGCSSQAPPPAKEPAAATVASTGKTKVALDAVPAEVLAAARAALPDFTAAEAEAETRDGRRYFDVGGTLPDGSEVEFDIMEEGGRWRVVETQRDIEFASAPALVREASAKHDAKFMPSRVIESRQADGVVIYELFGPANGDPQGRKLEIKWDGSRAEILGREWAH